MPIYEWSERFQRSPLFETGILIAVHDFVSNRDNQHKGFSGDIVKQKAQALNTKASEELHDDKNNILVFPEGWPESFQKVWSLRCNKQYE